MLSMLGIKQIAIVVNKMDLHDYDEKVFKNIKNEYTKFLKELYISPQAFIPISARIGENITKKSENMTWYKENDVLTTIDNFKKEASDTQKPFRLPVQDIYKFTQG
jgi:bifunctional enzyme CysN/CysC